MSSLTFNPVAYNGLSFTNIAVSETDTGIVAPFTTFPGVLQAIAGPAGAELAWGAVHAGVYGANSSQVVNFAYTVTSTDPAALIDTIGQLYTTDAYSGPGVSLVAVENVYDTSGVLIGSETYTLGASNVPAVTLSTPEQTVNVTVTLTLAVNSAGTNASDVLISAFQQSFGTTPAPATATIGDTVWLDTNGNGLDDNGEHGVAGVTVDLLNASTGAVIATTTTNASGNYSFASLPTNVTYEVQFVAPTGDSFTTPNVAPATTGEINSVASSSGLSGPITLTNGEVDDNVNAGLTIPKASIGDIVWLDTNKDGLLDNGESGVAGVTVELLNATGTSILATTTTNSSGGYAFAGLNAGTYEVKFLAPTGDTFTTKGVGSHAAINSSASQTTGVTSPITLTAGQVDNNVEAGLVKTTSSLSVLKLPNTMVVNQCGQVTYTFTVTNTGTTALSNVKIVDNIGTAANPDYVTPTLVTTGTNGTLAAGASWTYTETVNQITCTQGNAGSICHTTSGGNLGSGCTAWLSSSFNPTSCANGATYKFQGVTCQISGGGVGSKPITVDCPDSVVTFSSSCKTATTVYNASTDCWVTTLPANSSPGSVFLTGVPLTIPSGCNLNNSSVTWSIADSSNNCGASSLSWDASCTGYSSFNQNGLTGATNYNDIGVKSCDNNSGYGSGGSCDVGYGYNGSSYCDTGYNGYGGGFGGGYNGSGWNGSSSDCAGTPENQNTNNNCGSASSGGGGNNGFGSGNNGGYGGSGSGDNNNSGYGGNNNGGGSGSNNSGCDSGGSSGSNNSCGSGGSNSGGSSGGSSGSNNNCGSGGSNSGSCGDSGSATQTQGGILGAADTVTVTATAPGNTTVTASDTKEVQVLGSNSNVTVNGSATTSSLTKLYGSADTLEFTYTPGNTVSLKQVQAGLASVTGSNSNTLAFVEISNNANPFASNASIYFEGSVTAGEKIYADATTNVLTNTAIAGGHFSTSAGADMFAYVFASQAAFKAGSAPIQTMVYNTSGSQAMHLGDTIGSLSLVGFVGANGGHLVT